MTTVKKEAIDFKKTNFKNAKFAHINKDTIFIGFNKIVQGASVDYYMEFPNDNLIKIQVCQKLDKGVKSYLLREDLMGYLKDIIAINHWPINNCTNEDYPDSGVNCDTVLLITKKGIINSTTIRLNGKKLHNGDVEALYK